MCVSQMIFIIFSLFQSEDKKFKAPSNVTGALITLQHTVQQTYFPKGARSILQLFIGR